MNNEQFNKQIQMLIERATLEQINQAVKLLPPKEGSDLMFYWQMHHNPKFFNFVSEMVAAELK